jgi:hypothetical protein
MKHYEKVKGATERTGYSRNFLMANFDKPGITIRIGRTIRFDADALDAAIEEMQAAAVDHIKED